MTETLVNEGTAPAPAEVPSLLNTEETTPPVETDTPSTDATGDEKGAAEAPKKDEEKPKPEDYGDFDLPEGLTPDVATLDEFKAVASELGLTKEQAQKLVDLQTKSQQAQVATWEKTVEDWKTAATDDKEYGGRALKENLAVARKALDQFGSPELKEALDSLGVGNHPEFVRFFVRVGKSMVEDKIHVGGNPKGEARDPAKILFPSMN
jgi:hypothetical protein